MSLKTVSKKWGSNQNFYISSLDKEKWEVGSSKLKIRDGVPVRFKVKKEWNI